MSGANPESPIARAQLQEIATEACNKVFTSVNAYDHASTEGWNSTIISTILSTLVEKTQATGQSYKYIVNSTIIQHAPTSSGEAGSVPGKRGMHSASGAYWNNEKDGMWSFKYEPAEAKGLDVVVGITWVWAG